MSRIGSVPGLGELGTLYELRGRAQAALAKNAEAINFPLRIDSGEDFDEIIQHPRANYRQLYDETSRRFRSRHYRSYCDAVEVRIDASRWYRHALECFKATDDSFGVARAASAFAALNLNTIFLEIAWEVPPSNLQQRGAPEAGGAGRARRGDRSGGRPPQRRPLADDAARALGAAQRGSGAGLGRRPRLGLDSRARFGVGSRGHHNLEGHLGLALARSLTTSIVISSACIRVFTRRPAPPQRPHSRRI